MTQRRTNNRATPPAAIATITPASVTVFDPAGDAAERMSINVSQHYIITTRDKIELCLNRHSHAIGQRWAWAVPAGILLSTVLALATSDFKTTAIGLPGAVWQAVFIIVAAMAAIGTAVQLFRFWRAKSVAEVIDEIASRSAQVSSGPPVQGAPSVTLD